MTIFVFTLVLLGSKLFLKLGKLRSNGYEMELVPKPGHNDAVTNASFIDRTKE